MRLTRALSLSFFVISLALAFGVGTNAQTSVLTTLSMNLSLGSSGPQVLTLQEILNQSPDTRLATIGPGSPGNETSYFGLLTQAAVIRFQNKYASQILTPAGLTQANGFVGLYTRAILNSLVATANPPVTSSATTTTTSQNSNLQNASQFIALIDSVGTKQGLSSDALAKVNQAVLQGLATTTDLRAAFLKQARTTSGQSLGINDESLFGTTFATLGKAFTSIFTPGSAYAAAGTPFGGALTFSFYCDESDTWLIALTPLPPSYAVLLTYEPESQAFLSYNIPATTNLLGFYASGAGVCIVGACPYCYEIPNEGMISPEVGSSP